MRHIGPMDMVYNIAHYEKDDKHFLARSYVLSQKFERIYAPLDALKSGTAFEDLDKPSFRAMP